MIYRTLVFLALHVFWTCGSRSRLSLWIDERQVSNIVAGVNMIIYIISDGKVVPYINHPEFDQFVIPSEVDTVNLTWEAGHETFTYWFDEFRTLDVKLLYTPLLSIPASGVIPDGPSISPSWGVLFPGLLKASQWTVSVKHSQLSIRLSVLWHRFPKKTDMKSLVIEHLFNSTVFQISIPCTGKEDGISKLSLGLQIFNSKGRPIKGSPMKLTLKKKCEAFVPSKLCQFECLHGGFCNHLGNCECAQGFHGKRCELSLCDPSCENNGTCMSPEVCICPDGFSGKRCERALCQKPCQNGGRCIKEDVCWCNNGYLGNACQFSRCKPDCKNGGVCVGHNKCQCPVAYSGDICETENITERPRRSNVRKRQKKRRKRKNKNKNKKKNNKKKTRTKKVKKRRKKKRSRRRSLLKEVERFSRRQRKKRDRELRRQSEKLKRKEKRRKRRKLVR